MQALMPRDGITEIHVLWGKSKTQKKVMHLRHKLSESPEFLEYRSGKLGRELLFTAVD